MVNILGKYHILSVNYLIKYHNTKCHHLSTVNGLTAYVVMNHGNAFTTLQLKHDLV